LPDGYEKAEEIFMVCRNQVIVAPMGEVIDINIQTVISTMGVYGIRNQKDCLEKVLKIFHAWQKSRKKE